MRRNTPWFTWFYCILATLCAATLANAQNAPPAPAPKLPPLLHLRIAGPKGMKVTLFRGGAAPMSFDAPTVIGVRPGYAYSFALSNIPGFPGATFSPTLEVRGSLWLITQLRNADFPATVLFREDDFAKVEEGNFLRKVIVLERPDDAEPTASLPDEPLEFTGGLGRDLLNEASKRGAPLAVVFVGQRKFTVDEMAQHAVPGTLLFPGEKALAWPRVAPWIPWACYPVYDPRSGPPHMSDFTTLYDGGDSKLPVGHNGAGLLRGLDPTDTVAEYVDPYGRKRIVPSNRVSVCVPRFIVVRSEQGLGSQVVALSPSQTQSNKQGIALVGRQALIEEKQPLRLETALSRLKPSGAVNHEGTAITGRVNGTDVVATLRAIETLDGKCPPPTFDTPDRPLRIIKWPDCRGANVGDIVTFYLRYTNQGGNPITDVVVSDSLTTRFEYVAGSQQTDRAGQFTLQPNEAGTSILRWEFPGALAPGASGTISFQVKIR